MVISSAKTELLQDLHPTTCQHHLVLISHAWTPPLPPLLPPPEVHPAELGAVGLDVRDTRLVQSSWQAGGGGYIHDQLRKW